MERCLGLVYGDLDARGRVLDVDRLQNVVRINSVGTGESSLPWYWKDPSTCVNEDCGGYPVTEDTSDDGTGNKPSRHTGSVENMGPSGTFFTRKEL